MTAGAGGPIKLLLNKKFVVSFAEQITLRLPEQKMKDLHLAGPFGCLALLTALLCASSAAHATLIEYLPLNGTTTATVGTDGTPVNNPVYVPDQERVPTARSALHPARVQAAM